MNIKCFLKFKFKLGPFLSIALLLNLASYTQAQLTEKVPEKAPVEIHPPSIKSQGALTCQKLFFNLDLIERKVVQLKWLTENQKAETVFLEISEVTSPSSNQYLKAYASLLSNPHLTRELKNKISFSFKSKTADLEADKIWPFLENLSQTSDPYERSRIYLSISGKKSLPNRILDRLPEELMTKDSNILVAVWNLIYNLEKIEHPQLMVALRNFYLNLLPGDRPKVVSISISKPSYINDQEKRKEMRMYALHTQQNFMHLILKSSILPRNLIYDDFKKLLFVYDNRSYTAFELLLKENQIDLTLINTITEKLDHFNNEFLGNLLVYFFDSIIHASKTNSNLNILLVEMLKSPNDRVRSTLLLYFSDIKITNPQVIARLNSIQVGLSGQSLKLVRGLLDQSLKMDIKSEKKSKEDAKNTSHILRSILADSIHDSIGFSGLPRTMIEQLNSLPKSAEGIPLSDENVFDVFRKQEWGQRAFKKDSDQQKQQTKESKLTTRSVKVNPTNIKWTQLDEPLWKAVPHYKHSMPDIEIFLTERLGKNFLELALKSRIEVEVIAATESEMLSRSEMDLNKLIFIPNPYSIWDIDRYLDISGPIPKFIFRIQPNLQLAKHYQAMLHQSGVKNVKIYLSENGRAKLKQDFEETAQKIHKKIGDKAKLLIMGYESLWKPLLEKNKDWKIVSYEKFEETSGQAQIRVQKFEIQSPKSTAIETFLVIGSDKTLWGETSAYLIEGFLKNFSQLKDISFLGSAGSLGFKTTLGSAQRFVDTNVVYLPSAPNILFDGVNAIFIDSNKLSLNIRSSQAFIHEVNLDGKKQDVLLSCVHGFSNSPAEQTTDQVTEWVKKGITTVDVETVLIGNTINNWNLKPEIKSKVNFNVGHLITDNPASDHLIWDTKNSLTLQDSKKKQEARESLVQMVLKTWGNNFKLFQNQEEIKDEK